MCRLVVGRVHDDWVLYLEPYSVRTVFGVERSVSGSS